MKKLLLLLAVIALVPFASCNKDDKEPVDDGTPSCWIVSTKVTVSVAGIVMSEISSDIEEVCDLTKSEAEEYAKVGTVTATAAGATVKTVRTIRRK